jgi:hypothetical protein
VIDGTELRLLYSTGDELLRVSFELVLSKRYCGNVASDSVER